MDFMYVGVCVVFITCGNKIASCNNLRKISRVHTVELHCSESLCETTLISVLYAQVNLGILGQKCAEFVGFSIVQKYKHRSLCIQETEIDEFSI